MVDSVTDDPRGAINDRKMFRLLEKVAKTVTKTINAKISIPKHNFIVENIYIKGPF
jgi:hypothetical protein